MTMPTVGMVGVVTSVSADNRRRSYQLTASALRSTWTATMVKAVMLFEELVEELLLVEGEGVTRWR
jgi:hypothetical protein